jgi:hypothetical protein
VQRRGEGGRQRGDEGAGWRGHPAVLITTNCTYCAYRAYSAYQTYHTWVAALRHRTAAPCPAAAALCRGAAPRPSTRHYYTLCRSIVRMNVS